MKSQDLKKNKLPQAPGVYIFKNRGNILYIGKATSLKDRVGSYFSKDLISTRGSLLVDMVFRADKIDYIKTDSVLEALILEANLIKKYLPKYNTKEKDNKSFNYVVITREGFPRVLIMRGRNLENDQKKLYRSIFGPFTNSTQLKEALKIIRMIFPFCDTCTPYEEGTKSSKNPRPCFNYQIGLCPGVCMGLISKKDYQKNIKNIRLFFEGQKKRIIKNLVAEMKLCVKIKDFEKAAKVRNKIFALNHIHDVALIKEDKSGLNVNFRIEAYDAAHLSGTDNVSVMVVLEKGEFKKSDYRKFHIRESHGDDIGALRETLERRLRHIEWTQPNLIVVDGGQAQINIARKVIESLNLKISIVSVVKGEGHKAKALIGNDILINKYKNEILLINAEAHRFAIKFHRHLRSKNMSLKP
jgi:excinuclease ABC subunit C